MLTGIDILRISAIVAMSENRVIGYENKMPWHLPADLKHFKTITMDKPIIMGRKTHESIGRPLPGRRNIVISRDKNFIAPGCLVVTSIEDALHSVTDCEEIFVIGGANLYQQMLAMVERLYITLIHQPMKGDAFFPEINEKEWTVIDRIDYEPDEVNPVAYSFMRLDRKNNL